mgnify:CR=1 FL=1
MEYRLTKQHLLDTIALWNRFLKRKVHLIACGGTALTLLDIKSSTKDVDFMVPDEKEYRYLINMLKDLGYQPVSGNGWVKEGELYIFDLYPGKRVHTTELLDSPLAKGMHSTFKKYQYVFIGVLNFYDLIISKLFRGDRVDFEDCLALVKARREEIDLKKLRERFIETAKFDISTERYLTHLDSFERMVQKENNYGTK